MTHDGHDDDEYRLDYDHVEIDHDSDNKAIVGDHFNPVEEGSDLHLEIHRAVDELGKYAVELELKANSISKDDLKKYIEEVMFCTTNNCMEHGADLVGHVKSYFTVDGCGSIMSSIVHEKKPIRMDDKLTIDKIDKGLFVFHVIVHGIWDDKIRDLTLEILPSVSKKWNVSYEILADYYDTEKSIAHHL